MNKILKENADFKVLVNKNFKISKEYKEKKEKKEKNKKKGPISSENGSTYITYTVKYYVAFFNIIKSTLYRAWIINSGSNIYVINHNVGFVRIRDLGFNKYV